MLTHPNGARALCALVAGSYVRGLLLTNIPYAQLLVSGGGHQEVAAGVPGKRLHDVVVLQLQWCLSGANVPELDGKVARSGGEDVLGRGVEKDLTDLSMRLSDYFAQTCAVLPHLGGFLRFFVPRVSCQLAHGRNICWLLSIGEEGKILGDLPYKDLAIVGTGGDDAVVEGVPVNQNHIVSHCFQPTFLPNPDEKVSKLEGARNSG